jgi:hypothetical protein
MSYTFTPSSSRDRALYAQIQTGGPLVVPNAAGVWTNTSAQKVRFNTFTLAAANAINSPTYKTGLRSRLLGVRGRQSGSFTLQKPFFPSGTLGTKPDDDPILQSIFGATGAVSAGVSVTYSLSDALNFLFMPTYNTTPGAASPTNSYCLGAIPQSVNFTGGGNFLDYEIQGMSIGVGDSVNFAGPYAGGDLELAGGLTTYPAAPTGVTTNGNVIQGFGSGAGFSIGGSTLYEVRGTCEIAMNLGVEAIGDGLSNAYIIGFVGGEREINISQITCIDSDSTLLNSLKAAAFAKTTQSLSFVFGSVPGSIVTINLPYVQVGGWTWQESGAGLNIQFGNSAAAASTTLVTNEINIVLT